MRLLIALTALIALFLSATVQASSHGSKEYGSKTVVETLASNDNYSTLVKAVKAAGLAETLSGEGPFTVFAPTNDAFDALPSGKLESLLDPENRDELVEILTYHVIAGKVMSADIMGKTMDKETVEGSDLSIVRRSGDRIGQAADAHMGDRSVDRMYDQMEDRDDDRTGKKAYDRKDNKHMQNTGIMVNDARVIKADIKASNGVVHGIDKVLIPD